MGGWCIQLESFFLPAVASHIRDPFLNLDGTFSVSTARLPCPIQRTAPDAEGILIRPSENLNEIPCGQREKKGGRRFLGGPSHHILARKLRVCVTRKWASKSTGEIFMLVSYS